MRIILSFLFAGITSVVYGQTKITVSVYGFQNDKGVCRACLYNSADAFNGNGAAVQCVQVTISGKKATVVFQNVSSGTYAVSLFHDANNNNQFDTNFLGIPKEGYGASKNDLPFAAAPTFNGNKFDVKDNTSTNLTVNLRYLF